MATVKVKDKYRTNPLSLEPGGYNVVVVYEGGLKLVYDKVKKPGWYVKSISEKNKEHGKIVQIFVDNNLAWDSSNTDREPWDI